MAGQLYDLSLMYDLSLERYFLGNYYFLVWFFWIQLWFAFPLLLLAFPLPRYQEETSGSDWFSLGRPGVRPLSYWAGRTTCGDIADTPHCSSWTLDGRFHKYTHGCDSFGRRGGLRLVRQRCFSIAFACFSIVFPCFSLLNWFSLACFSFAFACFCFLLLAFPCFSLLFHCFCLLFLCFSLLFLAFHCFPAPFLCF